MTPANRQPESQLVTALGWITIVASGAYLLQIGFAVFAIGPIILLLLPVILAVVLSIVGIVCGCGLLKRRNWARITLVSLLSFSVVFTLLSYFFLGTDSQTMYFGAGENSALAYEPSFFNVIVLLLYGLGVYLLLRPDVKKEFRR